MKLPPGYKYVAMAGVAGVLAVVLVHNYISKRIANPLKPTAQIMIAEADIPPGTALAGRLVRVATWPQDIIPAKAVTSANQVEGRVAQVSIGKGEPITLTKLAPEGTAAGLGGLLDPNSLAVTVKTDEVSGVAGFVSPGDRIDVLVAMEKAGSNSEQFSKIILQNLKVLSKGQVWDQTADKKPTVVPTVTLEVSPEQAETLNLARSYGKICLALRNQLNLANYTTAGVKSSQLCYAMPPVEKVAMKVSQPQAPKAARAVQVIKGLKVSEAKF
jgi:pilus assembly protein CpaB